MMREIIKEEKASMKKDMKKNQFIGNSQRCQKKYRI